MSTRHVFKQALPVEASLDWQQKGRDPVFFTTCLHHPQHPQVSAFTRKDCVGMPMTTIFLLKDVTAWKAGP
jgi:hypothetical protein